MYDGVPYGPIQVVFHYLRRHLASGEGIVVLSICVCVSAQPWLHATMLR